MLEAIKLLLENVRSDIIQDQAAKRLTASGKSAASLEPVATETKGELLGDSSFYYQWKGRAPGKQPPSDIFVDWIRQKGIELDGISIESLAFLIARKIGREGTDIYKGKRQGLALDEIFTVNLDLFENEIQDVIQQQLSDEIAKAFGGKIGRA